MSHLINRRHAALAPLAWLGTAGLAGCTTTTHTMTSTAPTIDHVPWSRHAAIYEVNVRQFTPEGTLAAFEAHLPRLAQMGVGILWFMPIQPIGVKHRKGTPGQLLLDRRLHRGESGVRHAG
jgi:hypothetical protein